MELQYSRMNELGRLGSVSVAGAGVVDGDGLVCCGSDGLRVWEVPNALLDVLVLKVAEDVRFLVETLGGLAETSDGGEVNVAELRDVAREDDVEVRELFTDGVGPADASDLAPMRVPGVGAGAGDTVTKDVSLEEIAEILTLVLGTVEGAVSEDDEVREVATVAVGLRSDGRDAPLVTTGGHGEGGDATDAAGLLGVGVGREPVEEVLRRVCVRPVRSAKGALRCRRVLRARACGIRVLAALLTRGQMRGRHCGQPAQRLGLREEKNVELTRSLLCLRVPEEQERSDARSRRTENGTTETTRRGQRRWWRARA